MTIVTIAEARERLPELIGLMAKGEQVVFEDAGKWVASLAAPPPMPLTPEQEQTRQAEVKEAIREMVRWQIEAGYPPEPGSKIWELFHEEAGTKP